MQLGGQREISPAWRAWAICSAIAALLFCYVFAANIASSETTATVDLMPGQTAAISVFRFDSGQLDFAIKINGHCGDLGRSNPYRLEKGLMHLHAGAEIRMEASVKGSPPVQFEAMPLGTYCGGPQKMTSHLSVAPGVWTWPPPADAPHVLLRPGYNAVTIKVLAVDDRLVSERAGLVIHAPLGVEFYSTGTLWLWPGLIAWDLVPWMVWPAIVVALLVWASANFSRGRRLREESGTTDS